MKFLEVVVALSIKEFKMPIRRCVVTRCRKKRNLIFFSFWSDNRQEITNSWRVCIANKFSRNFYAFFGFRRYDDDVYFIQANIQYPNIKSNIICIMKMYKIMRQRDVPLSLWVTRTPSTLITIAYSRWNFCFELIIINPDLATWISELVALS